MENTKLNMIDEQIEALDNERKEIIKQIVNEEISEEEGTLSLNRIRANRITLSVYRNELV